MLNKKIVPLASEVVLQHCLKRLLMRESILHHCFMASLASGGIKQ